MTVSSSVFVAALALGAAVALGAGGCSSTPDTIADAGPADAGCQAYVPPATLDLTAPVVSLRTDVIPRVFTASCAFSSCHGGTNNNHGVLLAGDPAEMRAGLVGAAMDAPALKLVAPGDPGASFLMHKIDADQCTLNASCTGGDCGTSMPQASADTAGPQIALELRDLVRRWIAQGAADN
jgi:hypothetical protein